MDQPDARGARIAGGQAGVVTRRQLRAAGFSDGQVAVRIRRGQLTRLHRGVYLTGHAPATPATRAWAAMLACGDGAVVSHWLAATLWGFGASGGATAMASVDVTVPGRNPGKHFGIRVHRVRELDRSEVRVRGGLRMTAPARTICDLAAAEPAAAAGYALQEAVVKRLVTEAELEAVLARSPRRRGLRVIRAILKLERGSGFTRSEAERSLIRILDAARLPRPEKNVLIAGQRIDAVWRGARLIVEVDGWSTHGHRAAFERDRSRDQALIALGWRVIRLTARQLRDEPLIVAATLAAALARSEAA